MMSIATFFITLVTESHDSLSRMWDVGALNLKLETDHPQIMTGDPNL